MASEDELRLVKLKGSKAVITNIKWYECMGITGCGQIHVLEIAIQTIDERVLLSGGNGCGRMGSAPYIIKLK